MRVRDESRQRRQRLSDPYPWLMERVRAEAQTTEHGRQT